MSVLTWVLIAVVVVVVLLAVVLLTRRQRSVRLKRDFGPEYERTVEEGGRRAGETELQQRVQRRQELEIRPLAPDAQRRYSDSWRLIQERFVDQPAEATRDADQLVQQVMRERGYPTEDFEQQAADLSVDHPSFVEDYRAAHGAALASVRGESTTDDLREAILRYKNLFNELLQDRASTS